MAAGMLLALTIGASRTFFELRHYDLATDLTSLAIAAAAGTALTVFLAVTHRLPGGKTPGPEH